MHGTRFDLQTILLLSCFSVHSIGVFGSALPRWVLPKPLKLLHQIRLDQLLDSLVVIRSLYLALISLAQSR